MVETEVSKSIAVFYTTMHVLDCQALHTLHQSLVEPDVSYCSEIWGSTYQSRLRKLFMLQKKAMRIIYNLHYHDHTSLFFHSSKMIILYKANNLIKSVQAFTKPTEAIHMYGTRQSKLFYVKKQTPPSDYCHSLSKV